MGQGFAIGKAYKKTPAGRICFRPGWLSSSILLYEQLCPIIGSAGILIMSYPNRSKITIQDIGPVA
jgi:hypothetical protein